MNTRTILLGLLLFGASTLSACGIASGPTADIQRFADAVKEEDYHTAASYWSSDKDTSPEQAERFLVEFRAYMIKEHGKIKSATIQDLNIDKGTVKIIWQLERADMDSVWGFTKTAEGLRISSGLPVAAGRLSDAGIFATMTPLPTATLAAAELRQTAHALALQTTVAVQLARQAATDTAIAVQDTTVALHATATELAKPKETFLTARQAFEQAQVRETARIWQADAMLILVAFDPELRWPPQDKIARDGTSRVWSYMFASKQLQKTIAYIVQDGAILKDTGNDAATYKTIFAGKGEPFDIALEQHLDSDQVATIGRENKAIASNGTRFQFYLTLNPNGELLSHPPARWNILIEGFFGNPSMSMDGINGTIISSDFGPVGSPGAIPTPLSPPSHSAATQNDAAPSTPITEVAATSVPAVATSSASNAIAPLAVTASDFTPPGRDSQGNSISYDPSNVVDGKPESAWRVAGNGEGQSITLIFDQPVRLNELQIIPGYAKIDPVDGTNRFMQNRRVKRALFEFTNNQSIEATFVDTPELQPVRFDPIVTSFVRITIQEATQPGAKDGRDFVAISEVVAGGQMCGVTTCGAVGDAIQSVLAARSDSDIWTVVEGVDGDFARLYLIPTTPNSDSVWSFVKRHGNTWEIVTTGTMFPPDALQKLGVPQSLWL